MKKVLFALIGISALFAVACQEAPTELITAADQSLTAAQSAEAETYAHDAFVAARDSLVAARAEVAMQDGKFALLRNYGRAKQLFSASDSLSKVAANEAVVAKEAMRQEVEMMLAQADSLLGSTNSALDIAPAGKGTRAEIALLRNELSLASERLNEARAEYDRASYVTAKARVEAVMMDIRNVQSQLDNALKLRSM